MKIQYLGHSCFRLIESTGTTIITDPYKEIGYELPKGLKADAVTVSHGHFDHNNAGIIGGHPRIIDKEGFYQLPGVGITGIKSYHDDCGGALRGENIIYKFGMDGLEICHLGDLGEECSSELLEMILPVNILLIPVGGTYTIDAERAKEYVDRIMPEIVIPMHYKTRSLTLDLDKADVFLNLFDDEETEISQKNTLEFSRDDLTEEKTKIILMERMKIK
ncbi:MAG TPA: MBL fold metallo-hydrolase [Candidatus Scatosoma pullistercoris]|uniref:MBL fold metallo-hydrolase n=1 Tax=Candidatus Scatosoma pullistercoris TaxID=2840934 RepID=A0A9D1MET2_9FIRM|nr:MBL fold metallo-hydrolase [Candidatus Scatosoma pullistercoris]